MDIAADAVVATAFGERVERVVRVRGEHHLVVRYQLTPNDPLTGHTVARLENGYGLNVLTLQRSRSGQLTAIPPLEWQVHAGDELTVLANLRSLQRVEAGQMSPRRAEWSCGVPQAARMALWCNRCWPVSWGSPGPC